MQNKQPLVFVQEIPAHLSNCGNLQLKQTCGSTRGVQMSLQQHSSLLLTARSSGLCARVLKVPERLDLLRQVHAGQEWCIEAS